MTLTSIINLITGLFNAAIPIAAGLALLAFFWGVANGFLNTDDAAKRKDAQTMLVWSMIALFVIMTLAGIIAVFTSTFPDLAPR